MVGRGKNPHCCSQSCWKQGWVCREAGEAKSTPRHKTGVNAVYNWGLLPQPASAERTQKTVTNTPQNMAPSRPSQFNYISKATSKWRAAIARGDRALSVDWEHRVRVQPFSPTARN